MKNSVLKGALGLWAITISVSSLAAPSGAIERKALTGHVPEAVARLGLQPAGRLPAANRLQLAIALPLRNTNEMARLVQEVSDPASPQFRHYLTPEQFTERFGPTIEDYEAVKSFAVRHKLEIIETSPNRALLDVAGQVSHIEQAFNIKMQLYHHPFERRDFYAADVESSVEAGVPILDISGLQNYSIPRRAEHLAAKPGMQHPAHGSGPGGSLFGTDFRNAYVPSVSQDGAGQMVGLFAGEAFYPADITKYEALAGFPNVPIQVVLLAGFNGVNTDPLAGGEADLDVEMVVAMAPGLAKVVVFDPGPNGWPIDILNAMVQNPQIKQFSCSWIGFARTASLEYCFQQMALQGQSFFQASGDANSWVDNLMLGSFGPGIVWPADNPYVTSVGGTTLTMNGAGTSYGSETVWNWGFVPPGWNLSGYVGTGGGISPTYPIPSWQQGLATAANRGSATWRNFPDVAMPADSFAVVWNGSMWTGWAGTSFSAPLWAGFTALINQESAAHGEPAVGLLNPALYALGRRADYTNNFHDTTVGNNATSTSGGTFPAVAGYDLCTGWGSPNGSNLIHALALPQHLGVTPQTALLFRGPVGGPFSPASLAYSLTNRTGSLDWMVAWDVTWIAASPTSGTLVAGGSNVVVTVAPNLVANDLSAGSYTANLFFTNHADQSVQNRQVTLAVMGLPIITSQPTDQTVPEGMTVSFSVGTAPNALLSYQWLFDNGGGPTNLTDSANILGSATSTLTITSVSPTNVGAYTVLVSNAVGSALSGSAALSLVSEEPPVIISQPVSRTTLPGATVTFGVSAVGNQPLSYAWRFQGTNLTDAGNVHGTTTRTLTIDNASLLNSGDYSVFITNGIGSVTSTLATLNVAGVAASGVTLERLCSLTTNTLGCLPFGGLFQADNGAFYGAAAGGGQYNYGTVFRMDAAGTVTLLRTFRLDNWAGVFPLGTLVQGTNGYLYGTACGNGYTGDGAAFSIRTNGLTQAYPLTFASSGSTPMSGLVRGRDGNLYGTAMRGGAYSYGNPYRYGTVFKWDSNIGLPVLGSLNFDNGASPTSTLVQGLDGNFYGTAQQGGTNGGWGTIFRITPAGAVTPVFSFARTNGSVPIGGLVQDTDGTFYGTTYSGGAQDAGTVFKLAPDGTFTSLYSFSGGADGGNCYAGLILASDGNFYGTTETGGTYGIGTVFRMSPEGVLATLAHFDGYQGANPRGVLLQGTDGKLYGTTLYGGASGFGSIYRVSIDSPLQITRQPQMQEVFAGETASFSIATFGSLPVSYQWRKNGTNLVDGGNVSGSITRVLTLTNVGVAEVAQYSVVVSNSYGSVSSVGARLEVIFSPPYIVSGPDDQTVLAGSNVRFDVQAEGDEPLTFQWRCNGINLVDGGVISGSTTPTLRLGSASGAYAGAFSVVISNNLGWAVSDSAALTILPGNAPGTYVSVLGRFNGSPNAFNPYAGVIQGVDANFYGTTLNGGGQRSGSVFKMLSSGALFTLHSFTNGIDGVTPFAALIQASDGNFYGASSQGGGSLFGALFKLTTAGNPTGLHAFSGGTDGGTPLGALVQASDGNLYGTASAGGTNGFGAVFSVSTNGVFTPLWSFHSSDGSCPTAPLLQGTGGQLYGTTAAGGSNNLGTVFSIGTNGAFSSLVSFDYVQGANPSNGLVQASDGNFYGTASAGGTNGGWGTVFRVGTDGSLATLHSFSYDDGAVPVGGLLEATDGNLYGTTSEGGVAGLGTVFRITTNGSLTTLVWFSGANGASPTATLIQARNGSLYGTTEFGGNEFDGTPQSGDGVVFRLMLPLFLRNPFAQAAATVGVPYAASLSTNVVVPPGDTLTFAKVSGPAWLNIASNGLLSGTPAVSDIGTNVFTISLAETNGWASTAIMNITVQPSPFITVVLSNGGTNLLLSWSGRLPPYQVQMATDLANPVWQTIAGPMTDTSLVVMPTNTAAFHRIQSQ